MTIETSHGAARTILPRSSDLQAVPTDGERSRDRGEGGRVVDGNKLARGKGWKRAIGKMLPSDVADPIARAVADDAWRLFVAYVRDMPSDGPTVRALLMRKAWHEAMAGFWTAQSLEMGMATEAGIEAQDQATKHGVRAERLAVTALDIATKLVRTKPDDDDAAPWLARGGKPAALPPAVESLLDPAPSSPPSDAAAAPEEL